MDRGRTRICIKIGKINCMIGQGRMWHRRYGGAISSVEGSVKELEPLLHRRRDVKRSPIRLRG
ncbi:hypothetical protein BC826DRAFT_996163 [Russula brevipes]|nr:hypothetical protein BC826DRAFT_996163 [Russula brevipes]